MNRLYFNAIRCLFAPDAGDAGGGGTPAVATPATPAPAVATPAATDGGDNEPLLVRELPAVIPAAETPAVEAAADPAAPAIATPPAPPPAPEPNALQQELAVMRTSLEEMRTTLRQQAAPPPPTPATPAAPAAPAPATDADITALEADAKELERMLSDDYEVDVNQTPRDLAKGALKALKAVTAMRTKVDTELAKVRQEAAAAGTQAARETAESAERAQAFNQLQAEIRKNHPQADLTKEFNDSMAAARAEGFEAAGEKALHLRASQLFAARVQTLRSPPSNPAPAPSSAAPAAAAAVTKPAPGAPVTLGGAQTRQTVPGGNPRPAAGPPLTDDEIDSRHTLVRAR